MNLKHFCNTYSFRSLKDWILCILQDKHDKKVPTRHATKTESLLFLSVGDRQSLIRRGIPACTKEYWDKQFRNTNYLSEIKG